MILDVVLIAGKKFERTFRLISNSYASECVLDISVEVVFTIFFDDIRSKETSVSPVGIRPGKSRVANAMPWDVQFVGSLTGADHTFRQKSQNSSVSALSCDP